VPSIARLFNVEAPHAQGQAHQELWGRRDGDLTNS
jgi:hypothetical protein